MFAGKSTLRAKETVTATVDPALQAYLKRYQSSGATDSAAGSNSDGKVKRKKKKKPSVSTLGGGVRIVDESMTGFTPAKSAAAAPDEDEDDDDDYGEHGITGVLSVPWLLTLTIRHALLSPRVTRVCGLRTHDFCRSRLVCIRPWVTTIFGSPSVFV